jgi:hypothetical protein
VKLNRIAIGGVAGIMGLGLIGVGAHAAFSTTVQSHQRVTVGRLAVQLTGFPATDVASGQGTRILTFNASTTNSTSFTTGTLTVKISNVGTLPATITGGTLTGSPGNTLETEAHVCVASATSGTVNKYLVEYNGLLSGVNIPASGTLMSTHTANFVATATNTYVVINVFAGSGQTTACGNDNRGTTIAKGGATETYASSLTNTAQGNSMTVTMHVTFS